MPAPTTLQAQPQCQQAHQRTLTLCPHRFSPAVQSLANKVVYMMGQEYGAAVPYNGIHLRIEKDAMDWMAIMGGRAHFWQLYIREVRAGGMSVCGMSGCVECWGRN
jgi:hypothetical protein